MAASEEEIALSDVQNAEHIRDQSDGADDVFDPDSATPERVAIAQTLRLPDDSSTSDQELSGDDGLEPVVDEQQQCKKWQSLFKWATKLKSKDLALGSVAAITLFFTALALWPSIVSQKDTSDATLFAEWTSQKDFLEFCTSTPVC